LSKFTKGKFRMDKQQGVELEGSFSPFMRACIGIAIVCVALAPLILAGGKALSWVRWW